MQKRFNQTALCLSQNDETYFLEACYEIGRDAWNGYLQGSLKRLIETGEGTQDKKEQA